MQVMVDYIVAYQNKFVFSNLFHHNLVEMMNKGVNMAGLFGSDILVRKFDYDTWPSVSDNYDKIIAPYNNSIFKLRFHYSSVFSKLWNEQEKQLLSKYRNDGKLPEGKKLMIVYNLNMLTSLSNEDGTIMEAIANSEELEIFETEAVKDLIDYKW